MSIAFMFPGQSSRDALMFDRLYALDPEVTRDVLGCAEEVLGRKIRTAFSTNRDVQVAVFVANHAHLVALERAGVRADVSLGLSLGEYNHLVHIGAIGFDEALALVDARGAAYDAGPSGAMACVFPTDHDALAEMLRAFPRLEIVNFNSPMQHVIAGPREEIMWACPVLEEEGATCVIIEDRIPMHASRFAPVARALARTLQRAPWRAPRMPYLPNVTARFETAPTPARIGHLLARHVFSPVRWRESIEIVASDPNVVFVEVGPRTVLFNLLSRSWLRNARFATDGRHEGLSRLAENIQHAA
jgi:malonyl CoA-acyl carrier protein transacylase